MNEAKEMMEKIERKVRKQPLLILLYLVLGIVNVVLVKNQVPLFPAICFGVGIFLFLLWIIPLLVAYTITDLLYS